jgi:hypothetical protein
MDKIPEQLVRMLAVIGIIVLAIIIAVCFITVMSGIQELISRAKYRYKTKHRFDKPPLAKCYCKDCDHHSLSTSNECFAHKGWYTADNWFCWQATPRKHDEENSK